MNLFESFSIARNNCVKEFLASTDKSLELFNSEDKDELLEIVKILLSIPIEIFLDNINSSCNFTSDDIFQFSNFYNAIDGVISSLKFASKPLTYIELGKMLINSESDYANQKYGENHAKLARELSIVSFNGKKTILVTLSSFGDFTFSLSYSNKIELFKRLLLRNPFIKTLIYEAKKEKISYMKMASKVLSKNTAIRRRSNVKYVVKLILDNNKLLDNIVWS